MNSNDLYLRMCKDHPIQKEWKPKFADKTNKGFVTSYIERTEGTLGLPMFYENIRVTEEDNAFESTADLIWLPRQEDWQEKLESTKLLNAELYNEWKSFDPTIKIDDGFTRSFAGRETIRWCLFVSKEVVWKQVGSGITWDWDKNVWRKI